MRKTRRFLAQVVVEVDEADIPDFNEGAAAMYFLSSLKFIGRGHARNLNIYLLDYDSGSSSPIEVQGSVEQEDTVEKRDVVIEEYEYLDYRVQIIQDAQTIGLNYPTYFAAVWGPDAKSGVLVKGSNSDSCEKSKYAAEAYIEKRKSLKKKRNSSNSVTDKR